MTAPKTIEDGCRVSLRYQLRDDRGRLLESSGDEPSRYTHGSDALVKGLSKALTGRAPGDKFDVMVGPEEGYGSGVPSVGPQPIPRGTFPEDTTLVVGMEFQAEMPDGAPVTLYITDVAEHAVFVDKNHPFTGKTLHYAVEVIAVEAPEKA